MSSATNKKTNKKAPAAPVDIELNDAMDVNEKELCKKIRNGRKKLGAIDDLQKKSKEPGVELNDEQKDKVKSKKALLDELAAQENQLVNYRETRVGEIKKARELENRRQKELKTCREATVSSVGDLLVLINLRRRGVAFEGSAGVDALAGAMDALMTDGDSLKVKERENFTKVWASYMNTSGAKVPGTETTYQALNEGVAGLLAGSSLPATIPSGSAEAPKEPEKPKKAPKPIPAAYIHKAVDDKVVAEEDREEEGAAVVDADFLGGFDAFDSDGDDAQPAAKEEAKPEVQVEAPAPAKEGEGERKRQRWEDNDGGENRGRGGRGRGNNRGRGRGGRGRGGNPNVDEEGFQRVTDEPNRGNRGRGGRGGRGRGDRGRGERGDRGRGGRPDTAAGQEQAGGKEIGTRGGRPQSSRINAGEEKKE